MTYLLLLKISVLQVNRGQSFFIFSRKSAAECSPFNDPPFIIFELAMKKVILSDGCKFTSCQYARAGPVSCLSRPRRNLSPRG